MGRREYEAALEKLNRELEEDPDNRSYVTSKEFCLLKLGRFEEVLRFTDRTLPATNYSEPVSLINRAIALRKTNRKSNRKQLERVVETRTERMVQAAARHLLGDSEKAISLLEAEAQEDRSLAYAIRDWVVFDELQNDPKYRRIMDWQPEVAAAAEPTTEET